MTDQTIAEENNSEPTTYYIGDYFVSDYGLMRLCQVDRDRMCLMSDAGNRCKAPVSRSATRLTLEEVQEMHSQPITPVKSVNITYTL